MLAGLLLAGNLLSGFGGATVTPPETTQQPAGKRSKTYRESWEEHERYRQAAQAWIDDAEQDKQAAQEAPTRPRKAGPALTLPELVERASGLPDGDELVRAMVAGKLERLAQAAFDADHAVRRNEDEAVAMLLLLIA